MIVIVDYGMGNLGSVFKIVKKISDHVVISSKSDDILNANKIILPGVGSFAKGISNLTKLNCLDALNEKVLIDKTPILGICLGMQLFSNFSEEGSQKGLCWIDSVVHKFEINDKLTWKIPNIGWNGIKILKPNNPLLNFINKDHYFYFVHSYHMKCENTDDVLSTSIYENEFVSSVNKDNIYGTQFHPEKSHDCGLKIIDNFINLI